jgi:hypothetical protein
VIHLPIAPPCIGSGYCCHKAPCGIGVARHGLLPGPCRSLVWSAEDQRHYCGEILNAATPRERERLKEQLYVGEGCCSSLNSWRREPLQDRT